MTSERVEGHAFGAYEVASRWTPSTGKWGVFAASCECGEYTQKGVGTLTSAQQWHREHKEEVIGSADVDD